MATNSTFEDSAVVVELRLIKNDSKDKTVREVYAIGEKDLLVSLAHFQFYDIGKIVS